MGNADYKKRLKSLISTAQSANWVVTLTNNGHWRFVPPDKDKSIVIAPGTASDHRAIANLEAELKRSGLTP